MGKLCKICLKPILRKEDGVTMSVFGRGLFVAHREKCADQAKQAAFAVVRTAGAKLINAAEARFPGTASVVTALITHFGAQRQGAP